MVGDADGRVLADGQVVLERRQKILDAGQIEEVDAIVLRLEARRDLEDAEADEDALVEQEGRGRGDQADRAGLVRP